MLENIKMSKITILWYRKETSMNFNGSMYGYKREDGVVGSFSTKLLAEYEKLFDITWLIEKKDEDE
jgi:hypothetical protein